MIEEHDIDVLDQAIYETVHGYKDPNSGKKGVQPLAKMTGMIPSTLQNKSDRKQDTHHLSVKEARAVMLVTNDFRILQAMASEVGYAAVPLPANAFPADMDMLGAWADWSAEIAQTVEQVKSALEDGTITQEEILAILMELIEDFERGLEMLDVLKGMAEPDGNAVIQLQSKKS
jgi:hypothetical protein